MSYKGKFIVFEGIDGCGKSTQIDLAYHALNNKQNKTIIKSKEPGGTALGQSIREILLDKLNKEIYSPHAELLLYAADRAQHISNVIEPNLRDGKLILCDRFSASTLAYQGYGRGLNKTIIRQLEEIATKNISPDLTIFIDISVSISLQRRKNTKNDRIESEGEKFLQQVREGFINLSKSEKWCTINGENNIESIHKQILKILQNYI